MMQTELEPSILDKEQLAEATRLGNPSSLTHRELMCPQVIPPVACAVAGSVGFAWFIEKSEPVREAVGSGGLLVLIIAVLVGGLTLLGFAMYASFKQRAASLQSRYLESLHYFELKQKRDAKVEALIAEIEALPNGEPDYKGFIDWGLYLESAILTKLKELRKLGYVFPSGHDIYNYIQGHDVVYRPSWHVEGYDHSRHKGMFSRSDRRTMNSYGMDADTYINNVLESD